MSMNTNVNSGLPQLNAPLDLTALTDQQLQDEAAALAKTTPYFTQDQIMDQLTFLKEHGISLEQNNIDNLVAGNPILTAPDIEQTVFPQTLATGTTGNYWLSPNPLVTFMITYLSLLSELQREKLSEAKLMVQSIQMSYDLAKDSADLTIKSANAERDMDIAAAVAGAITVVASVASFAKASSLRKSGDADEGTITAWTQLIGQGGSALGTIMEKSVDAQQALVKGEAEAEKILVDCITKIVQRRMDSAVDTYKAIDDMMSQFLQNLQKMIDENFKAHGFQVH